jgi:1-acyl-sn-glycerol-3-phosphate acyltransferase
MSFPWRVVSALGWGMALAVMTLAQPILFLLIHITRPFDPERRLVGRLFHGMGVVIVGFQPWVRVRVERRTTQPFREPCVIVSNHESDVDVFVSSYLALLGWNAKYLSKESLYKLPVVGWGMRMSKDISVVRDDRRSRARAMVECRRWLERGVPLFFFPEGTRSRTGEMAAFKDGAFSLAIETGAPIQPIVFAGTRDALPPGEFFLRPARVTLRILDPIDVSGMTGADAAALAERVHDLVRAERDEIRRAHAGAARG